MTRSPTFDRRRVGGRSGLVFAAACAVVLATPANADDVILRNGSSFENVVVEQTDTHVIVELPMGGKLRLPHEQVLEVVVRQSPLERFRVYRDELLAAPGSSGADLLDLVRWAQLQDLNREARNLALVIAKAQPELEGLSPIMASLGYQRAESGVWMLEDDLMRARGLVRYDGEWLTRDERAARWQREAAEAARREEQRIAASVPSSGPSDNEVALESIRLAREVVARRDDAPSGRARNGQIVGAVAGFGGYGIAGGGVVAPRLSQDAYQQYRQQIRADIEALTRRPPGSIIPLSRFKTNN